MLGHVGVQLNYVGLCRGTVELCWVMSGVQLNYVELCRGTVELCWVMSGYS